MLNRISGVRITHISSYLPPIKVLSTDYIPKFGERKVKDLISGSGVESHFEAPEGMTSVDMCCSAAQHMFNECNIDVDAIDGLIFVTNSPDYIMPSSAYVLQSKLGISKDAFCVQTANGCPGFIYGVAEASSLISSQCCKRILLLCGETNSRFFNEENYLKLVFGDAAAAILIEEGDSEICFGIHADGSHYQDVMIEAGGFRYPKNEETKNKYLDDDGNYVTKEDMIENGMSFMQLNILNMPKCFREVLSLQGWNKDELDFIAMQQVNKFMLEIIRKKYGVEEEKCPSNIKECGNVGPASIPLLISQTYGTLQGNTYNKCVCASMGVGVGWGAITCDLSKTVII